jgi:hypothetical protein
MMSGTGNGSHSIKNLDEVIANLERVINDECAESLFGQSYWLMRIQQVQATNGIMYSQLSRLQVLVDRVASASPFTLVGRSAPRPVQNLQLR